MPVDRRAADRLAVCVTLKVARALLTRHSTVVARIIVIDDDTVIAELVRSVLVEGGHDPRVVPALPPPNGGAAPELVITDLVPLTHYGSAAAHDWVDLVSARYPGAPIIVLTAHGAATRETDQLGAAAVLSKPFDVDELLDTVDRVLAER